MDHSSLKVCCSVTERISKTPKRTINNSWTKYIRLLWLHVGLFYDLLVFRGFRIWLWCLGFLYLLCDPFYVHMSWIHGAST